MPRIHFFNTREIIQVAQYLATNNQPWLQGLAKAALVPIVIEDYRSTQDAAPKLNDDELADVQRLLLFEGLENPTQEYLHYCQHKQNYVTLKALIQDADCLAKRKQSTNPKKILIQKTNQLFSNTFASAKKIKALAPLLKELTFILEQFNFSQQPTIDVLRAFKALTNLPRVDFKRHQAVSTRGQEKALLPVGEVAAFNPVVAYNAQLGKGR